MLLATYLVALTVVVILGPRKVGMSAWHFWRLHDAAREVSR